jgi:signal recognition particle subunit SRP19
MSVEMFVRLKIIFFCHVVQSKRDMFKTQQEDTKKYHILYPAYLDKTLTVAQGRRIPKEKACDKPSAREILDICNFLKLKCVLEPYKMYSRDFTMEGRVRVELKQNGKCITDFKNKRELELKIAELIPKLQSRLPKPEIEDKKKKKKK